MYDPSTIQFLWRYMVQADQELLAAADTLDDAGYFGDQKISAGSVHNMLVHCMGAQQTWLERLTEAGTPPLPDPRSIQREQIAPRWQSLHRELIEFADRQIPESLSATIHSVNRSGVAFELPRGLCMLHVSDHASYHRGQVNSMIKLAGVTPSPGMLYTYGVRHGLVRELATS